MLDWIEAHPGLAAWVQAVGTIAAVLFAALLPVFQRNDADRATQLSLRLVIIDACAKLDLATQYWLTEPARTPVRQKAFLGTQASLNTMAVTPCSGLNTRASIFYQRARDAYFLISQSLADDSQMNALDFARLKTEFFAALRSASRFAPHLFDSEFKNLISEAITKSRSHEAQLEASGVKRSTV